MEDGRGTRGQADDALLDSYYAERQPLAETITRAALANAMSMGRTKRQSSAVLPRREFNEQGLIYGICYQSMAVISDGTPPWKQPILSPNTSIPPGRADAPRMYGCGAAANDSQR